MKTWQIFAIGAIGLTVVLFLPKYEPMVAGLSAVAIVTAVIAGFLARPRREVFYVSTITFFDEIDLAALEHDLIAVRIEVVRLWLLFVPTMVAVGFLVVTATQGTTWSFSLLDLDLGKDPYFFGNLFVMVVQAILSAWVSQRRVLRNAEVCRAKSVSLQPKYVRYSFVDGGGEYYGGYAYRFPFVRSPQLASLVLYDLRKPHVNKIAMGCLFHRPVIIGRGLTELDEATVAAQISPAQAES